MKNLISMTDFVISKYDRIMNTPYNDGELTSYHAREWCKYANFLKRPLELWMFIPCDLDGNVLEEPKISCGSCGKCTCSEYYQIKYQEAKERCLFEFEDSCLAKVYLDEFFNIEQLANGIRNIELTPTALKQIKL